MFDTKWASDDQATEAARQLTEAATSYLRELVLSGLAHLLSQLRITNGGRHVSVSARYGESDLAAILAVARLLGF